MKLPFPRQRDALWMRLLVPCLVLGLAASGCQSLPRAERAATELSGGELADADLLLKRADRFGESEEVSAVYRLRAAEIAWPVLAERRGNVRSVADLSETEQHALRVLNTASMEITPLFVGDDAPLAREFAYGGHRYRVSASRAKKPGVYAPAVLRSVKPASEIPRGTLTLHWYEEEGVGATLSPTWKKPANPELDSFTDNEGYIEPITAVLAFDGQKEAGEVREVTLTGYDPTSVSSVRIGTVDYPLAADFTAPIVDHTRDISEFWLSIGGLLNADTWDASLTILEPYDPNRIPVVLVHGLKSHPRMWRDAINDLRADPDLRGHYQFWIFSYPSGWPIVYSSMRLREELAALDEVLDPPREMILMGHSMGGLLSRMQIVTPGRVLWDGAFGEDADDLHRKLPDDSVVKRTLLFDGNDDVDRVIFVSVPHRGSGMADTSLAGWFAGFIKLPLKITSAVASIPGAVLGDRPLDSINDLSPSNPLFVGLERFPIPVTHHSIIGDRGKGGNLDRTRPASSDGVVPYWSSHLDSAQSELIVPSDHGAYNDPRALEEMKRILKLHLETEGRAAR